MSGNPSPQRKKLISRCPVCEGQLEIRKLGCGNCDTTIDTKLPVPSFSRLPDDLQQFVMVFLRCQGKIRDVEKELGISYPTVCKRLDLVNTLLDNQTPPSGGRAAILEQLERGEITAQEAMQLLKET